MVTANQTVDNYSIYMQQIDKFMPNAVEMKNMTENDRLEIIQSLKEKFNQSIGTREAQIEFIFNLGLDGQNIAISYSFSDLTVVVICNFN